MLYSSWRTVLVAFGATAILVPVHSAEHQLVLRQGIPGSESSMAVSGGSLSGDGRFVAFVSMADLLPGDTRRAADVYVIDRDSSTLTLETPAVHHGPSHGWSRHPRLSGDGRFLVFQSEASDLVSGTGSNLTHIFVRDRILGTTARVSHPDADHTSEAPAISDDGRVIAFESRATNLLAGMDANRFMRDVYLVRLGTNRVIRASVGSDGRQPSDGESHSASLSGDGRFLAFVSTATPAAALAEPRDRASRRAAAYIRDLVSGATSCVSCIAAFGRGHALHPHLSADARFVVFAWQPARGQDSAGTRTDIVLHDRITATTTVITSRANASSTRPRISANGRYIAFESLASNLECDRRCGQGTGDENLLSDVYLFDRTSQRFRRISRGPDEWWVPSVGVSIDREGTVVSFSSRQPLDVDDPTTDFDLFVRTLTAPR